MAQLLKFTIQDPQDVLDTYGAGALIRVERDTTSAMTGASEITTIAVVAGTTEYEYKDASGVAGTHYGRYRFSKASPSVAADYSGYFPVYQYGDGGGRVLTLETAKEYLGVSDTDDDAWLPLAIGAINRAILGVVGIDLSSSPATTRTYDADEATQNGTRLWVPGGIRAFSTVEVSTDESTWTAVTSDVRIGPRSHQRPWGEPGSYIEFKPSTTSYSTFAGWEYVRITGTAFATFGWDAWPSDVVQAAGAALQRMTRERDRQGQYPTETNALRYLDVSMLRAYRARYFPMVA